MKKIRQAYIYSSEKDIVFFLNIVLSKEGIEFLICNSVDHLKELCASQVPDILILDDKNMTQKDVFTILDEYYVYYNMAITSIVLLSKENSSKYRIDCILKCVDYFFEHPVDTVELIARIHGIIQRQNRMRLLRDYERNVSLIETMEKVTRYLEENVKKPIQKFIDYQTNTNLTDVDMLNKYVRISKNGAGSVLAAVNAIRDEVHQIICKHNYSGDCNNSTDDDDAMSAELNDLYEKNLSVISAAYNLDKIDNIKDE